MRLHWSPRSPYVRKVMIVAHELGLAARIERVRTVADMSNPNPDLLPDNPLGKIPTLVLPTGEALFDSLTICEYLDDLAGGQHLFPREREERGRILTWHALGDGLTDLLILWRNELSKPSGRRTPEWLDAFALKADKSLDRLEQLAPHLNTTHFGIAHIAIGCCLSYIDFRFANLAWRAGRPNLTAWHETFCSRPSARATEIVDG